MSGAQALRGESSTYDVDCMWACVACTGVLVGCMRACVRAVYHICAALEVVRGQVRGEGVVLSKTLGLGLGPG